MPLLLVSARSGRIARSIRSDFTAFWQRHKLKLKATFQSNSSTI
jgi:hypothetical protein